MKYGLIRANILVLVIAFASVAQILDFPFNGLKTLIPVVKQTVFAVYEGNPREIGDLPSGSGFLISKGNVILGVTCYHVAHPILAKGSQIVIGLNTKNGFRKFRSNIIASDKANDLVVLSPIKGANENVELKNIVIDETLEIPSFEVTC